MCDWLRYGDAPQPAVAAPNYPSWGLSVVFKDRKEEMEEA